jgi:crossover junction endodeoxyribonuclease RuvC
MNTIIGIDPGASGAIVAIYADHSLAWAKFKNTNNFTTSCFEIRQFIKDNTKYQTETYLEKVHSMPGQGVTSVFSFGRSVGIIEGMLKQENVSYNLILPQVWQQELGLANITGKETFKNAAAKKAARKQAYLETAKKLFPNYKNQITLDLADAILIAEYGYRQSLKEYEV